MPTHNYMVVWLILQLNYDSFAPDHKRMHTHIYMFIWLILQLNYDSFASDHKRMHTHAYMVAWLILRLKIWLFCNIEVPDPKRVHDNTHTYMFVWLSTSLTITPLWLRIWFSYAIDDQPSHAGRKTETSAWRATRSPMCMCVCMYVCMYIRMCENWDLCLACYALSYMYVRMYVCMYVCVFVRMFMLYMRELSCVYVAKCLFMYACMYVCAMYGV
jgi:hypothetical protein